MKSFIWMLLVLSAFLLANEDNLKKYNPIENKEIKIANNEPSENIYCYVESCPTSAAEEIVNLIRPDYVDSNFNSYKPPISVRIYDIPNQPDKYFVTCFNAIRQYIYLFDTTNSAKQLFKEQVFNLKDLAMPGYYYDPTFFYNENKIFIFVDTGEDQSAWSTHVFELTDADIIEYGLVNVVYSTPSEFSGYISSATDIANVSLEDNLLVVRYDSTESLAVNHEQKDEITNLGSITFKHDGKKFVIVDKKTLN